MKILITSGGTSEKIDNVREITNMATGRLGALIADEFAKRLNADITYICGKNAVIPSSLTAEIIKIGAVKELLDVMTTLLKRNKYTAVVHTMAVSDYSVRGFHSIDELSLSIAQTVCENKRFANNPDSLAKIIRETILQRSADTLTQKKIGSDITNPVLVLDKTAKVINIIKRTQPETILVGFKLLAGVSEDILLNTGHELLVKNACDFVLANDLDKINADKHEGLLIEPDGAFQRLRSKKEIAEAIISKILAKSSGAADR